MKYLFMTLAVCLFLGGCSVRMIDPPNVIPQANIGLVQGQ